MIVASWLLACLAVALTYGIWRFIKKRSVQLQLMSDYSEQFFHSANILLEDEDTPEVLLPRLAFMAEHHNKPTMGRLLFRAAVTGQLRKTIEHPTENSQKISEAIANMRPELRHQFGIAAVTSLSAASYTNLILGPILRQLLLFSVQKNEEQAEIVVSSLDISDPIQPNSAAA